MKDFQTAALEREDETRRKLHRQLMTPADGDGAPFGISVGNAQAGVHILTIRKGAAYLYVIEPDGISDCLAHADGKAWEAITLAFGEEFNRRLRKVGKPIGSWPQEGGTTRLHPCFGRELQVAMLVASESRQNRDKHLSAWLDKAPASRSDMWKRWHQVCNEDQSYKTNDLIFLLKGDVKRMERNAAYSTWCIDPLFKYVIKGNPVGLDDVFSTNGFSQHEMTILRRTVAGRLGWLSPEAIVDRNRLARDARDRRYAWEAEMARMPVQTKDEVHVLADLPIIEPEHVADLP